MALVDGATGLRYPPQDTPVRGFRRGKPCLRSVGSEPLDVEMKKVVKPDLLAASPRTRARRATTSSVTSPVATHKKPPVAGAGPDVASQNESFALSSVTSTPSDKPWWAKDEAQVHPQLAWRDNKISDSMWAEGRV